MICIKRKTHEEYVTELLQCTPDIKVIENYIDARTPIFHICNICNNKWKIRPSALLYRKTCPVCSGRTIGPPPEYRNSIWASKYKEYFLQFLSEKQMKELMPHSKNKVNVTCPYCGQQKYITIDNLSNQGLSCPCNDGRSFPNKFIYNVLVQLQQQFEPEYSPRWAEGKRYDIYIPKHNVIIENHGLQHYKEWPNTARSLVEEQKNDTYKEALAKENGISKYIVLDCRRSSRDWIKKSIMQSNLPQILNFSEEDIDWNKCLEYATKNNFKDIVDLFLQGNSVRMIANKMNISEPVIRTQLRFANQMELCSYFHENNETRKKPVVCIETGEYYESIRMAARLTGIDNTGISRSCRTGCAAGRGLNGQKLHWKIADKN